MSSWSQSSLGKVTWQLICIWRPLAINTKITEVWQLYRREVLYSPFRPSLLYQNTRLDISLGPGGSKGPLFRKYFRENICDPPLLTIHSPLPTIQPPPLLTPLISDFWRWVLRTNEGLTDRTHTRIVSFIVLDA